MVGLSLRPLRFALHIALAAAGLSTPARAQLPIHAPADPEPSALPPPARAEAVPAPPAAAPVVPPPAAPAVEPAAGLPPAPSAPVGTSPAPAKAELLTHQSAAPDDEETGDETTGELGPRRKWYGWQTLVVDGASFGAILMSASANRRGLGDEAASGLVLVGLLGYGLGPGVVHFLHHNTGRGFASFGLRLGMPIAGAIVGAAAASGCNRFLCEADGAAVGLLAGVGGAIAIDAVLLAYEDLRPTRPTLGSLTPLFVVAPGRAVVGVGGTL